MSNETAGGPASPNRREVLRAGGAILGTALMGSAAVLRGEEATPDQGALGAIKERLPRTAGLIEEAAAKGGAGQFYLSLRGKVVADVAWGKTAAGSAVAPETLVAWASAVKPLTCTCLMKLWEQGKLD